MTPEVWTVIGALIAGLVGGGGVGALLVKYKMQVSRQEADADAAAVRVLTGRIDNLNTEVAHLTEENHKLSGLYLDMTKKLAETIVSVGDKEAANQALNATNESLKRQMADMQASINRKDSRIAELERAVKESEEKLAALYAKVLVLERGQAHA